MIPSLPQGAGKRDSIQIAQRQRKAVLGVTAVGCAAAMVVTGSSWAPEHAAHEAIETAGLVMIGLAILGRVWCSMYLGGRKKSEVVRLGPYSMVRNPLYVFSVFGAFGVGLCTGSVALAAALGLATWLVFDAVIRKEERYLSERHGEVYADYFASVPRWRPAMSGWTGVQTLEVKPWLMWRTLRDASWFLAAYPLVEAVEFMQSHHWVPVIAHLP